MKFCGHSTFTYFHGWATQFPTLHISLILQHYLKHFTPINSKFSKSKILYKYLPYPFYSLGTYYVNIRDIVYTRNNPQITKVHSGVHAWQTSITFSPLRPISQRISVQISYLDSFIDLDTLKKNRVPSTNGS